MSRMTPGCLPDGRTMHLGNLDDWPAHMQPDPSDLACDDCGGDHGPGSNACGWEVG